MEQMMMRVIRIVMLAMTAMMLTSPAWGFTFMRENIQVELQVSDEQGQPLPYATVWGYVLPRSRALAIDANDLWRLTIRHQKTFEFATRFSGSPVTYLKIYPMADDRGHFKTALDYTDEVGDDTPRPKNVWLGFTLMKRGYQPARIDFALTDESRVTGKVVLKRDPTQPLDTQPYLRELERIRFELSDTARNEKMTQDNHERIEGLRMRLERAASDAMAAGDKPSVARILMTLRAMPEIVFIYDKPAGFKQSTVHSERGKAYLKKAYELDPDNPYIAAEFLTRYGGGHYGVLKFQPGEETPEREAAFTSFITAMDAVMQKYGEEIWPEHRKLYAHWRLSSSDPKERAKVRPMLEALYKSEPKFQTPQMMFGVAEEIEASINAKRKR